MSIKRQENREDALPAESAFDAALRRAFARRGMRFEEFCRDGSALAVRLLEEYGAMYVASESVSVPSVCVFANHEEVEQFQREATFRAEQFGEAIIELQPAAMEALVEARREAQSRGLDITPRGGAEAARRNFDDTLRLWHSRFFPALDYWCEQQRLTRDESARLCSLTLPQQIAEVLELERQGIFFSKDFARTILQSVAAPGASQHLAMLAFDATEFLDPQVRRILARHGWFQTIRNDRPHFTFLGYTEAELPAHGLRPSTCADGQTYWIPDMEKESGQ